MLGFANTAWHGLFHDVFLKYWVGQHFLLTLDDFLFNETLDELSILFSESLSPRLLLFVQDELEATQILPS